MSNIQLRNKVINLETLPSTLPSTYQTQFRGDHVTGVSGPEMLKVNVRLHSRS